MRGILRRCCAFKIKLDQIQSIDLSAIQVLLAMKKSSEEKNKELIMDFNLSEDQKNIITNAGFHDLIKQR